MESMKETSGVSKRNSLRKKELPAMEVVEDFVDIPVISKKSNFKKKHLLFWVFVLLTIVFASTTAYFAKEVYVLKNNPNVVADNERTSLVKKVSRFMALPKDEQPTVATINDLSALGDQPFFKDAQIGDKVLIYSVAKKAILFNPTQNKVIEVAPINDSVDNPEPESEEELEK